MTRPDRILAIARAAFFGAVVVVSVLSLLPSDALPGTSLSDKTEHLIAYSVLVVLGVWAYPAHSGGSRRTLAVAAGLVGLGLLLEFGQGFVPGRYPDGLDVVANTAGVVLGVLVSGFTRRFVAAPAKPAAIDS